MDDIPLHMRKRRRTDSGYGDLSQSSRDTSPKFRRQSTLSSAGTGKRACSPILLSDEPEIIITDESKVAFTEPIIVIYVGAQRHQVAQSKFLSFIWRDGLNSPCAVCQRDLFQDGDPPIRTCTFESSEEAFTDTDDITQVPVAPHPIRIINRHMGCVKSKKVSFLPISHVWHAAVSAAQMSGRQTLEAARLAYQVPVKTLFALTKRFGPVEIWHDYLSVPQWNRKTQQQLLLQIPAIFCDPPQIIMHLDDVQSYHLKTIEDPPNYSKFIDSLAKITQSRWFDRMWVTLEYIQAREVMILTQYYDVFETPAGALSEVIDINTRRFVKRLGHDRFSELGRAKGFRWSKRASWDDMEAWKQRDRKYRSLGGAISIIGDKDCRDHCDYFFALNALAGLGHDTAKVSTIFSDDGFESCMALTWDALENGDYSPLLFIPLESEEPDPRASWLHGHSKMSQDLWDLGACRRGPSYSTIIRDGKIKPKLQSVGKIKSFQFYNYSGSPEGVLQYVTLNILQASGTSPQRFCEAIDRIFPRARTKGYLLEAVEAVQEVSLDDDQYDFERIGAILERFSDFSAKGGNKLELLQLSKKLVGLLSLALPEKPASLSRIKTAFNEAQWYGRPVDALVTIECKICAMASIYRISAWESLEGREAELYRIPGLLYDDTVPEGVGLVVSSDTVVGKMAYGTPACNCRLTELVQLGTRLAAG